MTLVPTLPQSPLARPFVGGNAVCYSATAFPLRLVGLPTPDRDAMVAPGLTPVEARIGDTPIGLTWLRARATIEAHVTLADDADARTARAFADLLADDLGANARTREEQIVYEGDCYLGFVVRLHDSGLLDLELVADPADDDALRPEDLPLTLARFSHVRLPHDMPPTRQAAERYARRRLAALLAGIGRDGAVETPWSDLH